MRAPGIVGTIQLAAVLVFALPLALFGLSLLLEGRPLGAAFLGLAALMVALERHLTNPFDPADVAEAAAERLTDDERRD